MSNDDTNSRGDARVALRIATARLAAAATELGEHDIAAAIQRDRATGRLDGEALDLRETMVALDAADPERAGILRAVLATAAGSAFTSAASGGDLEIDVGGTGARAMKLSPAARHLASVPPDAGTPAIDPAIEASLESVSRQLGLNIADVRRNYLETGRRRR